MQGGLTEVKSSDYHAVRKRKKMFCLHPFNVSQESTWRFSPERAENPDFGSSSPVPLGRKGLESRPSDLLAVDASEQMSSPTEQQTIRHATKSRALTALDQFKPVQLTLA